MFALLIVLALALPAPNPSTTQNTQQTRHSRTGEVNETATDTPAPTDPSTEASAVAAIASEQLTAAPMPSQPTPAATAAATQPTPVPTPTKAVPQYTYYSVTGIVDGDTIKVRMNGTEETLRLIGMDTPETVDPRKPVQCFGKEASNKARELLSGKNVRLEMDPTQGERDKYGRLLAYVYREDGLFYNKYMIEQGYAHEYTYSLPYKYQAEFKAAQRAAQEAQRGLWSPDTCNGETASSPSPTPAAPAPAQSTGKYYPSSYSTAKYYYPEACDGWRSLSPAYLKSFDSLNALLAAYPSRTKSPQCE